MTASNSTDYLDYAAAAPLWPAAITAVTDALRTRGNPSSLHKNGRAKRQDWHQALARIARHLGCTPDELIVTSGATESSTTAITGSIADLMSAHVISSAAEHAASYASITELERRGCAVTWLPVNNAGQVRPADLAAALRPTTQLVSLLLAHNETGAIQRVHALTTVVRAAERRYGHRILIHWDAAQWAAWHPLNLHQLGADLVSLSGMKLGGPPSGLLYVRRGVALRPLIHGGSQQHGRRAGTEDVAAALGLAAAFDETRRILPICRDEVQTARNQLGAALQAAFPSLVRRDQSNGLPNILHITLPGLDAEQAVYALSAVGIEIATGAACTSDSSTDSHRVRTALHIPPADLHATLRISLGWTTTTGDIARLTPRFIDILERTVRQTSTTSLLQHAGSNLNQAYVQGSHV